MKVTRRELLPGETFFGGGKGVLIPYRLDRTSSSAEPSKDAVASSSAPQEADPMQGAADKVPVHGTPPSSMPNSPETDRKARAKQMLDSLLMGHLGPLPMD